MSNYAEAYYRDQLLRLVSAETEWLDLGCGRQLLPMWLKNSDSYQRSLASTCKRLVGLDALEDDLTRHPHLHARVVGNLMRLPFQDETFDLASARSVIEHVSHPAEFIREVCRVLKPGGRFLFATPNFFYYQTFAASIVPYSVRKRVVLALEGRAEEDVFPTYYLMNTPRSVEKLVCQSGLAVESLQTIESPPEFFRVGGPVLRAERAITSVLRCRWFHSFRAVIVAVVRKPYTSKT